MNTPITDAAAQTITMDCDDSCLPIYVYESGAIYEGELVPATFARRLETDRAALMKALETTNFYMREHGIRLPDPVRVKVRSALSTARANFPRS